ncbi:hypothetical protein [Pseudomonas sp. NPDC089396]|uniref:hypothetical protein n=1 Tax=Pseudomonas sp. NPDC089396 TaxID=3364461 RepID=UPI0038387894
MNQTLMESTYATPEGVETEAICGCCNSRVYSGMGWLESDHTEIAAYWYEWADGHDRFYLAVARFEDGLLVPGIATLAGKVGAESISYTVLDSDESPWPDFDEFGLPLSRDNVFADATRVFDLIDAIAAKDQRISSRILSVNANPNDKSDC